MTDTDTYMIIRHWHPSQDRPNDIIKVGLSLESAQAWCNHPDTREDNVFFDGYTKESNHETHD